ncbi:MAG: DNA polymerase subunit beta [Candidatus Methanophagaceae archaeon]|nr:MAG: DNA polymerase subunit beta [Methanophagales archaeon]
MKTSRRTRARLRDFVVTEQDWIFSVVSYDLGGEGGDEEEIQCLLRYVPDKSGERVSEEGAGEGESRRYRKLDFHESFEFLRRHRPDYLKSVQNVHSVPRREVKEILRPEERLPAVAGRDERVRSLFEFLKERGVQGEKIGITGSFLCGLNTEKSDLDFVVYGRENFDLARSVVEQEGMAELKEAVWRQIYEKRQPALSYDNFVAHERRKKNRGVVGETYFDILFARDWEEIGRLDKRNYERGERVGYAEITAVVKDASFAFDSPAIYEIEHPEISKILSFTHTYAGQAFAGEEIAARGVVERTKHETRLVVGTTREARGEWIIFCVLPPANT